MFNVANFTPVSAQNINFGKKKELKQPEKPVDVIDQAYKITNDIPEKEKFFSPGADLAFPLVFSLPYAYARSDHKLAKLTRKLAKATKKGNTNKIAELTEKVNTTEKLIKEGVNIKAVTNPKAAFKEYGGKSMLLIYAAMQGMEVFNTLKELGPKAAIKQLFRGVANTAGSMFGWVAGSAVAHKVGAKIGGAIGAAMGGSVGRFIGNLVGTTIGFVGGILGERLMDKAGQKIYGKSEIAQAKDAQYEKDLKNIDLNDKLTLKQQLVKNQLWLMQFADEAGNVSLTGKKKVDEKIEIVNKATNELYNKFKAAGGTEEELKAAMDNPEEVLAQQSRMNNNNTNMYYSGAFNSATAKGDPRFNGYTQRVFA